MESWMDVTWITLVGPPPSSFPCLFFNVHSWLSMLPAVGVILGELVKAHAHPQLLVFQPLLSVK